MNLESSELDNVNDAKVAEIICMEPLLYRGLTATELVAVSIGSFLAWTLLSMLILILCSAGLFLVFAAFPVALIFSILTVIVCARVLQRMKRNRPDGYYTQLLSIRMKQLGLKNSHIIVNNIKWDI